MILKCIVCLICISYIIYGLLDLYNDTGYVKTNKYWR